ncbi:ComF family protein [Pediococcus pentosaceus]|nr:phosphoribosyltransferase family protein [Pediococcus pentosaceus]
MKSGCDISGEHILLVDDIYTTGATLRQARTTLLRNGATQVRSVTLCR